MEGKNRKCVRLSIFLLLLALSLPAFSQEPRLYYVTEDQLMMLEDLQKTQQMELQTLEMNCNELQTALSESQTECQKLKNDLRQSDEALERSERMNEQLMTSLHQSERRSLIQRTRDVLAGFAVGVAVTAITLVVLL